MDYPRTIPNICPLGVWTCLLRLDPWRITLPEMHLGMLAGLVHLLICIHFIVRFIKVIGKDVELQYVICTLHLPAVLVHDPFIIIAISHSK